MSARAPRKSSEPQTGLKTPVPSTNYHQMIETLEQRTLLSAAAGTIVEPNVLFGTNASSSSTVTGYTPAQIKAAYGLASTGTGAGETIAIVDAYNDPNIASDLKIFDAEFGLAAADLKVVNQSGGSSLPANNAGWDTEISLDVEWAHAIAPGATILLVETSSDSLSSLLAGVNYARDAAGVSVVSMSWGGSEFSGETSYDSDFTTPAGHQGVTFVASAGDEPGTEWPAISPDVLSVGGTTLELSSSGAYESEIAWSDGGGGASALETEPSYQEDAQTAGVRSDPDVSWDADPDTGVAVYDSVSYEGSVGWQKVGGTSVGAPSWSGLIAIADQARGSAGSLNGISQTLPILYTLYSGGASSSTYASAFNDVTSGGGSGGFGGGGGFGRGGFGRGPSAHSSATVGYDTETGLGSPKGSAIVSALVAGKITTSTLAATSTSSTGNAGGGYYFGRRPFAELLPDLQTVELAALSRGYGSSQLPESAVGQTSGRAGYMPAAAVPSEVIYSPNIGQIDRLATLVATPPAIAESAPGGPTAAPMATLALTVVVGSRSAAPLAEDASVLRQSRAMAAAGEVVSITWSLAPAELRWYQAPTKMSFKEQATAAIVGLGAAAAIYQLTTAQDDKKKKRAARGIFSDTSIFS